MISLKKIRIAFDFSLIDENFSWFSMQIIILVYILSHKFVSSAWCYSNTTFRCYKHPLPEIEFHVWKIWWMRRTIVTFNEKGDTFLFFRPYREQIAIFRNIIPDNERKIWVAQKLLLQSVKQ